MAISQACLKILPSFRCLLDKVVRIKVEGLPPHKTVKLRSKLVDDRGVVFKASALYEADEKGIVDLFSSASMGGSYKGVEPMGLFWALAPETPHCKFLKKNVLSPTVVVLEALNGDTDELLTSECNERGYLMEGMRRIPVKEGQIRGVLFIPPGDGPFPGIIDLHTLGGGLNEPRASLLAGKGFVVLALAYYRYKDLPKNPQNLELEYFDEALTYLRNRTEVKGPGIGIISISHSCALALSMSSFLPGISATVCINGCNANTVIPLHYKDTVFPPLNPVTNKFKETPSGLLDIHKGVPDPSLESNKASMIPIERASCQFLFAVSEDDCHWNSLVFAKQAAATLQRHGKESFQLVTYPKAGHFLEVPFVPCCQSGFHSAFCRYVLFGGEPKAHSEAQLDLWQRVQQFFKSQLVNKDTL